MAVNKIGSVNNNLFFGSSINSSVSPSVVQKAPVQILSDKNGLTERQNNGLSLHSIKNLEDVCCVYCGQKMLSNSQVEKYSERASHLKGTKLAKFLTVLQPSMKINEKLVVNIIKEELKKNPNLDLKGVLERLFPKHIARLEKEQEKVLLALQKIASGFSGNDKLLALEQIQKGLDGIKKRDIDEHFKRNKYIDEFYSFNDKFENFGNYLKIMNAIKSMPNTYTSIDALIVKYSRKSSKEIMRRLLSPNQSSIEHLHPRSKGGTNILTNLVLACRKDNSARRSEPLETMPDLSANLPLYFESLKKSLAKKFPQIDFEKVKDYEEGVKSTIKELLKNDLYISEQK